MQETQDAELSSPSSPETGIFPRFNILGIRLTATCIPDAVGKMLTWIRNRERRYVCIFAVGSILECRKNAELSAIANSADMVLTDGMPLVWLGRRFGGLAMSRCYGPDTMLALIDAGRKEGIRHYFYGGASREILDKLKENLKSRFPDMIIAGSECPPFRPLTEEEKAGVASRIEESGADVVWVGIGTPKQDFWVGEFRKRLSTPLLIAVGAAFNFHAGVVCQAPRWMMKCGLEWLFRLCVEPKRLWRRYIIGNPKFIIGVIRQKLTKNPAPLCEADPRG